VRTVRNAIGPSRVRGAVLAVTLAACVGDNRSQGSGNAATSTVTVADSAGVCMVTITSAAGDLPEWRLASEPLFTSPAPPRATRPPCRS
jgi:hypothetical protein